MEASFSFVPGMAFSGSSSDAALHHLDSQATPPSRARIPTRRSKPPVRRRTSFAGDLSVLPVEKMGAMPLLVAGMLWAHRETTYPLKKQELLGRAVASSDIGHSQVVK
jgi:hypothetical protein